MGWGRTVRRKIALPLFFFFNLKGGHASVAIFCYFDVLTMTVQHQAVTLLLILLQKPCERCSVSVSDRQHKTNDLVNLKEVVVFFSTVTHSFQASHQHKT